MLETTQRIVYTDYTLTMFDDKTNEVKWNLTYSELKDIGSANSGGDNFQVLHYTTLLRQD